MLKTVLSVNATKIQYFSCVVYFLCKKCVFFFVLKKNYSSVITLFGATKSLK